ncbi:MAG TPA: N-acetyltransferase [Treponema sp.]|nr:N-acetyltransferase [Treponema sp.]
MKLREYKKEDSAIIGRWVRTEEELYLWSADRFNIFPLLENTIEEKYRPQIESKRFFPLTAIDEDERPAGHFIIRYPKEDDNSRIRFGFVIVSPQLRGKGYGRQMLTLGLDYARNKFTANTVDLGVFANNESARHCYEAVGFREYARRQCILPIGTWECIDMEQPLHPTP